MSETITCTGCGGERIMTDDQIDVPENGLCAMELDSCPSDQVMMMTPTQYDLMAITIQDLLASPHLRSYDREDVETLLAVLLDLDEYDPDAPMGIYTPTPYHQTGGTNPQQNKEE